jgi:hypothetical protein
MPPENPPHSGAAALLVRTIACRRPNDSQVEKSLSPLKPVSISGNSVNYIFLFAPPNLGVLSMTSRAFNIVCKRLFPFCLISWSYPESFQAQAPKKKPEKIGYVASGEPPILRLLLIVLLSYSTTSIHVYVED